MCIRDRYMKQLLHQTRITIQFVLVTVQLLLTETKNLVHRYLTCIDANKSFLRDIAKDIDNITDTVNKRLPRHRDHSDVN